MTRGSPTRMFDNICRKYQEEGPGKNKVYDEGYRRIKV